MAVRVEARSLPHRNAITRAPCFRGEPSGSMLDLKKIMCLKVGSWGLMDSGNQASIPRGVQLLVEGPQMYGG